MKKFKRYDFFAYPTLLRKKAERESKLYTLLGVIILGLLSALTLLLSTFDVFDRVFGQGFMVNLAASFISSIVLFVLLDLNLTRRREQTDLNRMFADLLMQSAYYNDDLVRIGEESQRQADIQERLLERYKADPIKNADLTSVNVKMAREQLRKDQLILMRLDALTHFAEDVYRECLRLNNLELAERVQSELSLYHKGRSIIQTAHDRLQYNTDTLEADTKEYWIKQQTQNPEN